MFKSTYGTMYYVNDMKSAVNFYSNKLGLKPSNESPDWSEFDIGGHKICLHVKESGKSYKPNGILIFNHVGVKSLHDRMARDGINVSALHEVHPGHWTFEVTDCCGNQTSVYGPA
jgi:predicted enzyme related to lactoylglutathione lyase